jgi:uncharacterized protein (TIGR00255 family)
MRSMTGYGRGEVDHAGVKFSVELNSVNRKQSDIVINLPRDLAELEPRIRQAINEKLSRGRTSVIVALQEGANGSRKLALDTALARSYHEAMRALQTELGAPGEITIGTILQAPGVMRFSEHNLTAEEAWPAVEDALAGALHDLIKMREREGRHLSEDLAARITTIREAIREVGTLFPKVVTKYRAALHERISKAGLEIPLEDERLLKEVAIFADRSDVSEELTRLESHLTQFAEHLKKDEPVGRALEFITQEIFREHAEVHGKYYGTLRQPILSNLDSGVDVLIDIDIQGAAAIRSVADEFIRRALCDVFIMPPDLDELRRRLTKRGTETAEQIELRLMNAAREMELWRDYRYTIISKSMEEDLQKFRHIMGAERYLSRRLVLS